MRKENFFTLTASVLIAWSTAQAQTEQKATIKAFQHLELSFKAGTTGYGFDLATPLCDFARLRSGFTYMPRIEVPMDFAIQVGDDPVESKSKFKKMSGMLESFTGQKVNNEIEMTGRPNKFWNWNVLVDFFPLKNNKHWHVTAGFSLGPSHIAEAFNTTEDMPSLMAVKIYNQMYDKLINDYTDNYPQWIYETSLFEFGDLTELSINDPDLLTKVHDKLQKNGRMGVHVGNYTHNVYYTEDVYIQVTEYDDNVLDEHGNPTEIVKDVLVHQKGDIKHAKGDPYIMEPDEDCMAKATMKVNRFKPYLGLGYEGRLLKDNNHWKIGFDAGLLFWGGTPVVKTHEGIDLMRDVENIDGKVGDYVDTIDKFKVYPVLSLRLTYKLF